MPNLRPFLLIALAFVGFLLWQAWERDHAAAPPAVATGDTPSAIGAPSPADEAAPAPDVPTASASPGAPVAPDATPDESAAGEPVRVTTDLLRVEIDLRGANVVHAELLRYPVNPKQKDVPVTLLDDSAARFFVAQAGVVASQGDAPDHRATYRAERRSYALDGDVLEVPLVWLGGDGVEVHRTFRFTRGSYVVEVVDEVRNAGAAAWSGSAYRQLQRTAPAGGSGGMSFTDPEQYSFVGAAWHSPEEKFEKRAFDEDYAEEPLDAEFDHGWAAMLQHYFFAAWIPPPGEKLRYTTQVLSGQGAPRYLLRAMTAPRQVAPGATTRFESKLYLGPKLQGKLDAVAPGLERTIDYGTVTVLAEPLFWLLALLHRLVGNWGFAIILITVLVKLALYPLSEAQYRSMAKMRKMQPRMAALKERYGDDRQKYNQAMMEFYQKEKINPMGGCLPIVVQIPVFIALYWVLLESVELRQAPFALWIDNLSARDPYFVLPVLNGLAMYLGQKLTPAVGMDPVQQKMMQFMPILFAVMTAFMPAGLVLYWTVNGVLSLLQQYVITRRIDAGAKA